MLALFAVQATGTLELVSTFCEQGCVDDDEQGRCADDCTDCGCCFHPRPTVRTVAVLPSPAALVLAAAPEPPTACSTAPPGEILHVPIALA